MKELEQVVANAFSNIVTAGAIEKAIEEKLTKTITSIINDELQSYSDFGKQLSEHVKKAVQVDFSNLGLPGYNDLILKIIRQRVDANLNEQIEKHVTSQLDELLAPAPEEITLSELVADFIKFQADRQSYSCSCDLPDRITLLVETDGSFTHIALDKEDGSDRYKCPWRIDTMDGRVYSVKINEIDPKKAIFIGPMYGFERKLFQLYAAGTKLVIDADVDEIDTSYPGRGYD
ncbi:hypothetical protein GQ57_16100 [Burkholderia sp. MSh2]|uniref:Gp42 n=1 Tax=Burkholderia paludis TaxID=1506587 RepID=A0A6J5DBW5_9BURK|nr:MULTISPECIES: hypothetical protein [Burkholderia]KEZ04835.1 hypothetical protein GQ57_16100 [Burkholderia sp. MSh2]CAB3750934.1 hypothetical protein LMG30113_01332 [Burkholderia paludis]VWB09610.1 gp42 [Burkholderia paludis]